MPERVWQSVTGSRTVRTVMSQPRLVLLALLLLVAVATQGAGAVEGGTDLTSGVSTDGQLDFTTGP